VPGPAQVDKAPFGGTADGKRRRAQGRRRSRRVFACGALADQANKIEQEYSLNFWRVKRNPAR